LEEFSSGVFLLEILSSAKVKYISDLERSGTAGFLQEGERGIAEINSFAGGIMTTDPVCGMKVDDKRAEFHTQFAGKKYFFCSENCQKEFEASPDEYVESAAA
jgi:YHS domain-containing protein